MFITRAITMFLSKYLRMTRKEWSLTNYKYIYANIYEYYSLVLYDIYGTVLFRINALMMIFIFCHIKIFFRKTTLTNVVKIYLVPSNTCIVLLLALDTSSRSVKNLPVSISLPNLFTYWGIMRPTMMDIPMTARFRVEVRDTDRRLERVTPTNMPIIVIKDPPSTG